MVKKLQRTGKMGKFTTLCFSQALSAVIAEHGRMRGGNSTGLNRLKENAVLSVAGVHVTEPELREPGGELAGAFCADFKSYRYAKSFGRLLPWSHGNHANKSQNPFRDNGRENLDMLRVCGGEV